MRLKDNAQIKSLTNCFCFYPLPLTRTHTRTVNRCLQQKLYHMLKSGNRNVNF